MKKLKSFFKKIPASVLENIFASATFPTPVVGYPFGAYESQAPAYAATLAVTIGNDYTFIKVSVTGNMTVNLTETLVPSVGAEILAEIVSDASIRTITWGTGFLAPALTTVASKTHVQSFIFDGINFVAQAPQVQLN